MGRASTHGIEFLAIYIGPSLGALLFWPVLRKIIRITRTQRITGIADFISIRYGKNFSLAVVVALRCVMGIIPYIALQLKAISQSMALIIQQGQHPAGGSVNNYIIYITGTLGLFILLFGTRSIDASEKHEGMVAAIAFESIVKLIAFLMVGIFITFFVFNGFGDVFEKMPATSRELFSIPDFRSGTSWVGLILLSMLAVFLLPRQFQVMWWRICRNRICAKHPGCFRYICLSSTCLCYPLPWAGCIISRALEWMRIISCWPSR